MVTDYSSIPVSLVDLTVTHVHSRRPENMLHQQNLLILGQKKIALSGAKMC